MRHGFALMYLVALAILTIDLTGLFLLGDCGACGQKSQTGQALYVALNVIGIKHLNAHHLIATADAKHRGTLAMSPHDGLGTSVAA